MRTSSTTRDIPPPMGAHSQHYPIMKTYSLLPAVLAALVLTSSTFAYTPKDSSAQAAVPATHLKASKVVNPSHLPLSFKRQVVDIEFSLDAEGRPQNIKVISRSAAAAQQQIVQAFKQWKFESVTTAGQRTEGQRFILPLDIVPEA